ncbi:cache domain-containing protein [Kineococcus sp. SYSU DK001]|uniref:cache domain-containing protein n=1 Tax=Kineococcus sp. SYSU DK001 TaxID=3383122 RepID=UPI003D7EC704
MRGRHLTIKSRLVLSVVAVLALALVALVAVVSARTQDMARDAAHRETDEVSERSAAQIREELTTALGTSRDLAATLGGLSAHGGTRAQADAVEHDLLAAHPGYLAVWSAWEPDAFDGQDAQHAGTATSDGTGRYISYWHRDGSDLAVAALTDYETPGPGDYYLAARDSGREKVLDP